jgi:hypothetical protein
MRSMNASGIVPFLVIALLFAFSSCRNARQSMQWTNDKIDPAFAIASDLNKATTCEVLRVDDSYPNEREPQNGEDLHGYAILSKAAPLSGKSRDALSGILADPSIYIRYKDPPDCSFRPGIAFRFTDGSIKVDLLVCFSCRELQGVAILLGWRGCGDKFFPVPGAALPGQGTVSG